MPDVDPKPDETQANGALADPTASPDGPTGDWTHGPLATCPPAPEPIDPRDAAAITLMGLLVETHARLIRVLGAEMEESCGLPLAWYDAMIRLRRSPGGFTTMTRLASEVSLTSGGITRLVDRLVDAGYAERSSCPTDRRSVYVSLTPAGIAKVGEATAAHRLGLERHLLAPLDDDERAALEKALRKLRQI